MNYDSLTLKELNTFGIELQQLKTIGEWKTKVREFGKLHNLTDKEAVKIANKAREGVYSV